MKYVWNRDLQAFVDRYGRPMEAPDRICAPLIQSDIKPYMSPLGTGEISSRSKRRYDLDKSNCREVDPSEFKPRFVNKKWAAKRGYKVDG